MKTTSQKHHQKDQSRGQGLVEYIAITALVAIVCVTTVKAFGSKVRTRLNQISNNFDKTIGQGLRSPFRSKEAQDNSDDEEFEKLPNSRSRTIKLPF